MRPYARPPTMAVRQEKRANKERAGNDRGGREAKLTAEATWEAHENTVLNTHTHTAIQMD